MAQLIYSPLFQTARRRCCVLSLPAFLSLSRSNQLAIVSLPTRSQAPKLFSSGLLIYREGIYFFFIFVSIYCDFVGMASCLPCILCSIIGESFVLVHFTLFLESMEYRFCNLIFY